ncbi:MAG: ATP phosphoribosyltransferase [Nitrospirae bacterium]|nr:ATP phosphoribosyltransferase [Nitrospirota bacterium]
MIPLTIALPKGKLLEPSIKLFDALGLVPEEVKDAGRRLIFESGRHALTYLVVRPTDVPTYVEYGAADIGIVGKDMLLEQEKDLYELLNLRFGYCRVVVAGPKESIEPYKNGNIVKIRVATKYPRITEKFFGSQGVHADIIKLYGSIELAPLVGLSHVIVDLISTGRTLKENNLEVIETVTDSTARLIANRASLKLKYDRINDIVDKLRKVISK